MPIVVTLSLGCGIWFAEHNFFVIKPVNHLSSVRLVTSEIGRGKTKKIF